MEIWQLKNILMVKWSTKEKWIKKKFKLPSSWTFEEFWNFIKAQAFDRLTKRQKGIAINKRKYGQVMDYIDTARIITPLAIESNNLWLKSKKMALIKKLELMEEIDPLNILMKKEFLGVDELKEEIKEEKEATNIHDSLEGHIEEDRLQQLFDNPLSPRSTNTFEDEKNLEEKVRMLRELEKEYPTISNTNEYKTFRQALNKHIKLKNFKQASQMVIALAKIFLAKIPRERTKCLEKVKQILKDYWSEEEEETKSKSFTQVMDGDPYGEKRKEEELKQPPDRISPIKEAFMNLTPEEKAKLISSLLKRKKG